MNTTNPGSRTTLATSAGKENVGLSMTYATTNHFFSQHIILRDPLQQVTVDTNHNVYPPHQQQLYQTAPTNITLSSSTSYSYSAPITTIRALPLTTTPTLRTVLPPFNHFFSYPNYSLPPTGDMTRIQ